jgi:pimeloyl-ACP methyl ester carboxylesterase
MLTGWTGDTSAYHRNYPELSKHFHLYILDYRCHGLSESPEYGLHVTRLAKDVAELIDLIGAEKVNLLGHSMGNAVIWAYIMLFGQDKINKIVHEDEPPCLSADPVWTDEEDEMWTGGSQKKNSYWTLVDALEQSWEAAFGIFNDYFPMHAQIPDVPEYNYPEADPPATNLMSLDHKKHAVLLQDHMTNDWRDVLPTIKVPVLLIGGMASHCTTPKSIEWQHQQIKNSRVEIFTAEEYGVHEMHAYNPEKFNKLVIEFLEEK